MITLAVTGTPDNHRGPVFLVGPIGQRATTALTCFFGFRTDLRFRDFYAGTAPRHDDWGERDEDHLKSILIPCNAHRHNVKR